MNKKKKEKDKRKRKDGKTHNHGTVRKLVM
jgi:hypothetical protein